MHRSIRIHKKSQILCLRKSFFNFNARGIRHLFLNCLKVDIAAIGSTLTDTNFLILCCSQIGLYYFDLLTISTFFTFPARKWVSAISIA